MSCITKIVLTRSSYAVKRGEWVWNPLSAVLPSSAACNTIIWSSSNTCVVAINRSSGAFHGLSAGEATITASAADGSGVTARATVSVRDKIYVSSVTLNRSSLSLNVGKSATLTASVKPTNADNKNLKWTSGNPCVAKVSSDGKVTAVSTGRAQITAETTDCSGCSADCFVTVTENKLVTDLQIRPSSAYTVVDSSAVLTPYITPSDATNKGLKWWSENTKIATVSGGNVIGISPGDVKIYAETTDGTAIRSYATVHVRQRVPVESVEIVDTPDTVRIGSCDGWAYACVKPTNATNQRVFWSSNREEIIDVTYNTGHLDARLPGKATITAMTYDGKFTDSKTLRSVYDKVIIEKDDFDADEPTQAKCAKVRFVNSGKVWHTINVDMIYEIHPSNSYLHDRSNANLFTYYDKVNPDNSDITPRVFTDDELCLLYAIDPFGVADYVDRYATSLSDGYTGDEKIKRIVAYKDRVFKKIFGRDPYYYERRDDGNFYSTSRETDLNKVLSESEGLFGAHVLYDGYGTVHFLDFVMDSAKIALELLIDSAIASDDPVSSTIKGKINAAIGAVIDAIKSAVRQHVLGNNRYAQCLYDAAKGEGIGKMLEDSDLDVMSDISTYTAPFEDLYNLITVMGVSPNYTADVVDYIESASGFDVYIKLTNGQLVSTDDVLKAVKTIENQ